MDPRDEGRHRGAAELFALDLVDPTARLAVAVLVAFGATGAGCAVTLVGADRPCTTLVEPDAGRPRDLELRAPGLWADLQCLVPHDHVTFDLEAFAVALDDPADALGDRRGTRVPFGAELEWDTVGAVRTTPTGAARGSAGYELVCRVHGVVLVGDERLEIDGFGSRRHLWAAEDPARGAWARTVDGSGVRATAGPTPGVPAPPPGPLGPHMTLVADAPFAAEAPLPRRLDRALVVVQDPGVPTEPSLAWIERSVGC